MKYLKTFEKLSHDNINFKIDKYTTQFINGEINEKTYIEYFHSLDESIFSDIKEMILNSLYTFLVNAVKVGISILDKVKTVLNLSKNTISKFKTNNPTLYKVIIITIIVFILLIISAATVHAAQGPNPKPIEKYHLDFAIGFIDKYISDEDLSGDKSMIMKKAIAALMKIREHHGVIDFDMAQEFGKEAEIAAKSALKIANDDLNQAEYAKNVGDKSDHALSIYKLCIDMMKKGQEYLHYNYEHFKSGYKSLSGGGSTERETIGFIKK